MSDGDGGNGDSGLTPEDIVTWDDTDELTDEIADEIAEKIDIPDTPDLPDGVITEDDISGHVAPEAEKQTKAFFQHVVTEDCDSEACDAIREAIGVENDHEDPDGDEASENESDDADDDESDGDETPDESGDEPSNAAFPDEL